MNDDIVTLSIGPVSLAVPQRNLPVEVAAFALPGVEPLYRVELLRAPVPPPDPGALTIDATAAWRMSSGQGGWRVTIVTPDAGPIHDLRWRDGSPSVVVTVSDRYPDRPALMHPLDQILWRQLLIRSRAVLVHGSLVRRRATGEMALFCGRSGAGKSTIAGLLDGDRFEALADDRVVVGLRDGRPWAWSTPWHGSLPVFIPGDGPLRLIASLAQEPAHRAEPMETRSLFARVMQAWFPPFDTPASLQSAFSTLAAVLGSTGRYHLGFAPDRSVADLAERLFDRPESGCE